MKVYYRFAICGFLLVVLIFFVGAQSDLPSTPNQTPDLGAPGEPEFGEMPEPDLDGEMPEPDLDDEGNGTNQPGNQGGSGRGSAIGRSCDENKDCPSYLCCVVGGRYPERCWYPDRTYGGACMQNATQGDGVPPPPPNNLGNIIDNVVERLPDIMTDTDEDGKKKISNWVFVVLAIIIIFSASVIVFASWGLAKQDRK